MNSHDTSQRQARGQIQIGIRRLAGRFPFHTNVLERLEVRCQPEVGTMGVTLSGDVVRLLYNPEFVLSLPLDQLGGVLLHEVHHIVFGHLTADPADYPDRWARTMAEEVTVNEYIREPLPDGGITLDLFPALPARESTGQRYERLKKRVRRIPLSGPGELPMAASASGNAEGSAAGLSHRSCGGSRPAAVTLDDHTVWPSSKSEYNEAAETFRALLHDAAIEVGTGNVPDYLNRALQALGIGQTAGDTEEDLDDCGRGRLDWTRLLRRYIGRDLRIRHDFRRPPRRFPDLAGVVPGRARSGSRPRVMAIIDTSASITTSLLKLINTELARLAADYEVTVVECDAEIQRVYSYRRIRSVLGRGGTSFLPPFEPEFLRKHRPDLIVYFTDGFGSAPDFAPRLPVLWCLTPDGEQPADWGRVIRMAGPGVPDDS